jgi:hypothetical protein
MFGVLIVDTEAMESSELRSSHERSGGAIQS